MLDTFVISSTISMKFNVLIYLSHFIIWCKQTLEIHIGIMNPVPPFFYVKRETRRHRKSLFLIASAVGHVEPVYKSSTKCDLCVTVCRDLYCVNKRCVEISALSYIRPRQKNNRKKRLRRSESLIFAHLCS